MLPSNTNFDTKNVLADKWPMYLVAFDHGTSDVEWLDGTDTVFLDTDDVVWLDTPKYDYCDHKPASPENELKQYLAKISGLAQKVTPEEGRLTIGGVSAEIMDVDDEITALLATDPYFFHRKKTTAKAGYQGLDEADMLTIMTGWITDLKLNKAGLSYIFTATDPQKWMQRKIFRGSEDSTVTISGNPLTILLALLTSTGNGTNGAYDYYDEENGLGIEQVYIDVAGIEQVRDDWFPGDSHKMEFSITKRIKAKDFFEKEIFKILNLYPVVDGQGRFGVKPFKPPLAATSSEQTIDRDVIIGMPTWNSNLPALVNEVEAHYDWNPTTEAFDTIDHYFSSTSLTNRGPGKKPIVLKSKGLKTSNGALAIMAKRAARIFERFAVPPIAISFNTFFSKWLSEAGDIISFTHSKLPDIAAGTRGITARRMEVISRSIDWKRGRVKIDLLDTGFGKGTYNVISPTMTVLSAADGENFVVSAADAVKYSNFTLPECQLATANMRQKVAAKTILTINTTTGAITCDDWGVTPVAGDIVLFADYDNATTEQKAWGYIADSSNKLGAANDDAHLIVL